MYSKSLLDTHGSSDESAPQCNLARCCSGRHKARLNSRAHGKQPAARIIDIRRKKNECDGRVRMHQVEIVAPRKEIISLLASQ